MKVCIDMGHTPASPGASGYIDELTLDREFGKRIAAELQRRGHTVVNTTPPDWMAYPQEIDQRVSTANASGADLLVSVHYNAGGGTGTEVLHYPGDSRGQAIAAKISANLSGVLGLTNRGTKARDNVGVIANTSMTAVLIETCFVDMWEDKQAHDAASWDEMTAAVCDGIEGKDYEGVDMPLTNEDVNKIAAAVWNNSNSVKDTLADRVYRNTSMLKALCGIGEEDTRDPKGFAADIRSWTIGRWERSLRILKGLAGIEQDDVTDESIKTPMRVTLSEEDIDKVAKRVAEIISDEK